MLEITEQNISLKLGFQKNTGFNYDWKGMGVPNKQANQPFAPFPFWKLGQRTKNF